MHVEENAIATKYYGLLNQDRPRELMIAAVGDESRFKRFAANIAMEVATTPHLQKCTPQSLIKTAIQSANLGLVINKALGHAWLVPYNRSYQDDKGVWQKETESTLQIGYKGYITKFDEAGYSVEVENVTIEELEAGRFEETRGTKAQIIFRPIRDGKLRVQENIALTFAVATKRGRAPVMVVLTKEEILEAVQTEYYDVKTRMKTRGLRGVWKDSERATDFGEMCKKTAIRRLSKVVPISSVNELSAFEAERDKILMTAEDIKDEDKPAMPTNMAALSGIDGKGTKEMPEEIPDEVPILVDGSMHDVVYDTPADAANGLLSIMEGRTKEQNLSLLRENQQLLRYLIRTKDMELFNQLHASTS